MSTPSAFQQRITGEWAGRPSLFDAHGTWRGFEDIRRSSVHEDGVTTYYMDGGLTGGGDLAGRFALGAPFAFGVLDSDGDRIYTGPDFYGSGQPYGGFVDANYYGPGWQVSLQTWNQTIGDTQVYSSVLYQGPAMVGVFNGLYTRDPASIDQRIETETRCGAVPFTVPTKQNSCYAGDVELWSADQKPLGSQRMELAISPVNLLVAEHRLRMSGAIDSESRVTVRRDGVRSFHEGPDVWGNGNSYGRANFVRLHTVDGRRLLGREFMMDAEPGMGSGTKLAVVYQMFEHNGLVAVMHGVLERS
ncbi:hypothetical protein [Nocardia huaxiensis]|uniref:Uncharacterized protein n=1 Tax=Nocardia huaxiensis TaxID=2755382 RepID=A0A7D6VBA5_9NOCA|nr:hypothetical protein [Nocardia huaxiensis]QLY28797.1 hypothetical protein H0264_26165 [Nocardia huaxiensis]UFS97727.1 hypothetical protein LPY97_07435 [Nocardia huaxiensis]